MDRKAAFYMEERDRERVEVGLVCRDETCITATYISNISKADWSRGYKTFFHAQLN